jgi:pantothenate kinase-related protein Tda10
LYNQRQEKHSNWLLGKNALDAALQKLRAKTFYWSEEQAFVSDLPNALEFGGCLVYKQDVKKLYIMPTNVHL